MSLVNSALPTLTLRFLDMVGSSSLQRVHSRIFEAYDVKSLVLEVQTEEQLKLSLLKNRGVLPPGFQIEPPTVIENWTELEASYKPTNVYQLRPRRSRSNLAYAALRSIAASPGSPWSLEDRTDPGELKLLFKPADFEYRNTYNMKNPEKVGTAVVFDGLLRAKPENGGATGLLLCHTHVTVAQVNIMVGSVAFMKEWCQDHAEAERHKDLKTKWASIFQGGPVWSFLASNNVVDRNVLQLARTKNIHIYVKRGTAFSYSP